MIGDIEIGKCYIMKNKIFYIPFLVSEVSFGLVYGNNVEHFPNLSILGERHFYHAETFLDYWELYNEEEGVVSTINNKPFRLDIIE